MLDYILNVVCTIASYLSSPDILCQAVCTTQRHLLNNHQNHHMFSTAYWAYNVLLGYTTLANPQNKPLVARQDNSNTVIVIANIAPNGIFLAIRGRPIFVKGGGDLNRKTLVQ